MASDGKSLITSVGSQDHTVWLHDKDGDHQISSEGDASSPTFSSDGRSLYFLMANGQTHGAELWVKDLSSGDLNSGKVDRVVPGYPMQSNSVERHSYSVSQDGKEVAFAMIDQSGRSNLWVAPTNHRSSPQHISSAASRRLSVFPAGRRSDLPRNGRRIEFSLSHESRRHRPSQDHPGSHSGNRGSLAGRSLGCRRVAKSRRRTPGCDEGVRGGWKCVGVVMRH